MSKFAFTRLQYDSGDWDVDQRMPSNLLNSLIEYTTIPGRHRGAGGPSVRDSGDAGGAVHLSVGSQAWSSSALSGRSATSSATSPAAASSSSTTATTTSTASSPGRSRAADGRRSSAPALGEDSQRPSALLVVLRLRRRPADDELRAERLGRRSGARLPQAIEVDGRIAVLYSNKDYGCEWDYDYRNKRWLAEDNTRASASTSWSTR